MGGSSRRRDKNRSSDKWCDDDGESAARTRPLSFDEIMSRRKKKSLSGKDLEESGNRIEGDESRRGDEVEKEEHGIESSRKTRHRTDEDVDRGKGREIRDLDAKLRGGKRKDWEILGKSELDRVRRRSGVDFRGEDAKRHLGDSVGKYGRPEGSRIKSVIEVASKEKTDDTVYDRRKGDSRVSDRSENEAGKRHSRDLLRKSEEKTDDTVYDRRKGDSRVSDRSENEAGKRHSRDLLRKSERADEAKTLEVEDKRKYQNGADEKNRDKGNVKRHDIRKGHDSKIPERKDGKESRNLHFEEERMKRHRSRSREREERKRRSTSPSVRAHKRASYHGKEHHQEISTYSHKDRPERRHSDIDRSKLTNNGSISHQRRHGDSSGLGGYSPRKRRSEAAVKTPSPTRRSPEKKSAKWDRAPERTSDILSTSTTTNSQLVNQAPLKSINVVGAVPSTLSKVKHVPVFTPSVLSINKIVTKDSIQLTQATRPFRRLYVENIPPSVSESTMIEFLNNLLLSSGANHIEGTQPCLSCIIHKEKSQALVEFLTPEDASLALSFDGCLFLGYSIKIRRPKDFVEVATGEKEKAVSGVESVVAKSVAEVDSVSEKSVALVDTINNVVQDSPNKIFIGGISSALSSKMLMEIAMTFGSLKAYQFICSKDHREPFAFLEYADESVTLKACAGLNGMKFGGKVITAVQAVPDLSSLESRESPFCGLPEHAIPLLEEPAQVLRLKNLFDAEALSSLTETEIEEILEDVRLECARFGAVKSLNVVKGDTNHPSSAEACYVNDQNFGNDELNTKSDGVKDAFDDIVGRNVDGKTADVFMEDESYQPEILDNSNVRGSSILGDKSTGDSMDDDSHQPESVDCKSTGSNTIVDENYAGDTAADEPCQPKFAEQKGNDEGAVDRLEDGSDCGTFTEGSAKKTTSDTQPLPQLASKDEQNLIVQAVKDSIQVDTSAQTGLVAVDCLNVDEISEETKQRSAADKAGTEAEAAEKGNKEEDGQNLGDIFEPGCVFVEFRRIESSRMAAHCLHRRTFDDRIVTVRYVPLDIYRARFTG